MTSRTSVNKSALDSAVLGLAGQTVEALRGEQIEMAGRDDSPASTSRALGRNSPQVAGVEPPP